MRQDTDKEKETDRVKQLVIVREREKKKEFTHPRACLPKHTHTYTRFGRKKKKFSGLHADSSLQNPTTGGSRAVGLKHAALTGRHTYLLLAEGWGRKGMWEGNWLQNLKIQIKTPISKTNESLRWKCKASRYATCYAGNSFCNWSTECLTMTTQGPSCSKLLLFCKCNPKLAGLNSRQPLHVPNYNFTTQLMSFGYF